MNRKLATVFKRGITTISRILNLENKREEKINL